MKVPTPRRRPTTVAAAPSAMTPPIPPTSSPSSADNRPTSELQPTAPNPDDPIVYETLRQDATVHQPDDVYLVPGIVPERAAQPVDLTQFLAYQQMYAAVGNSGELAVDGSGSAARTQPLHVVKKACRPPPDAHVVAGCSNVTEPSSSLPQSPQRSPVYTNMDGASLPESLLTLEASLQLGSATNSEDADSAAANTAATVSSSVSQPTMASLSSVSSTSPSACSDAVRRRSTFRLPSYEESMSLDVANLNLSPIASPSLTTDETTGALPGYEAPPAYVSDKLLELNANSPLKSRQVQQLQDEMASVAGIRVQLDKAQCALALALIDCFDRVW